MVTINRSLKFAKTNIQKITHISAGIVLLLPTFVALAAPATVGATGGGWAAKYWNLASDCGEAPDFPTGSPDLTRTDNAIDFDWGTGSPDASIHDNCFAAEWTKSIYFDGSGYKFTSYSDDGVRIMIDDETIIDQWYDQQGPTHGAIWVPSAGTHTVKVRYYENTDHALIRFTYGKAIGASGVLGQPNFATGQYDSLNPNATGFDYPNAVQVDAVHHRLFTADENANRVLVFNLDSNNQLVDKTADYVLGQTDFTREDCNTTATVMCEPYDITYDVVHDRLFVADADNERVLVYNTAVLSNGMPAAYVLGQPDMTTSDCCGVTAATMDYPTGVAYDATNNRLFVADSDNERVLVFDVASITNGEDAVHVLGQTDMSSENQYCFSGVSGADVVSSSFCWAPSLSYDSTNSRLFVSDSGNQRVMVFDVASITDGEDAVHVLGQPDLVTHNFSGATAGTIGDPRSSYYDNASKQFFIVDAGWSGSSRVMDFDLTTFTDGEDAVHVLGQSDMTSSACNQGGAASAATLCQPYGLTYVPSTKQLFVADSDNARVLAYDLASITDGEDAIAFLGQSDFASTDDFGLTSPNANGLDGPFGNALDTVHHRLFVADRWNNRVVVYNLTSNNKPGSTTAAYIIGQPDELTDSCNTASDGLCDPFGVAYDSANDRLFVSDKSNQRVMVYDVSADNIATGMDASYVFGQPDMDSSGSNNGGRHADSLSQPMDIALDATHQYLYVADRNNHRVLGYDVDPEAIQNHESATRVVGQANFTSGQCNRGGSTAANTLCYPRGVAVNPVTQQLFVADGTQEQTGENRVLAYDMSSFTNGQAATAVLGQPDVSSSDCNTTGDPEGSALCNPMGMAVDNTKNLLYVGDEWNDRIMVFNSDPETMTTGEAANFVIGQAVFENSDCDANLDDTNAYGICDVAHVTVDQTSHAIYLSDVGNNRVLYFSAADMDPSNTAADLDGDGIADSVEDNGPNGGDANNDGIPDSEQANVSSFVNTVSGRYAALAVDDSCTITTATMAAESANTTADSGFDYPVGLMHFVVTCSFSGASTSVTQYFYDLGTQGLIARKYNSTNHSYQAIPGAAISAVTIAGHSVTKATYTITDGGSLDEDGTANGTIVDPSGVASAAVGAPNTGFERAVRL